MAETQYELPAREELSASEAPGSDGDPSQTAVTLAAPLSSPRFAATGLRPFAELVVHLVKREIDATHRMTVLGWAWPLARQLAQLAVLVFIFGSVLQLGIKDFPVFVFTGLIAWTWFAVGISTATGSLLAQRHLLYQPRLPPAVLPIVAVVVPLVDVLMALPVLAVMLLTGHGIPWTAVLLPIPIVVQLLLMAGFAWLTSAASVFFRDVPNVVAVGLTVSFYMTPVFYGLHTIPKRFAGVLRLNPMASIVDSYRALLLGQPYPSLGAIGYTVGLAIVLTLVGFITFKHVQHRFIDNL